MFSALHTGQAWLARARALIPAADRAVLVSPPALVLRFLRYTMATKDKRSAPSDDVDARDPQLIQLFTEVVHQAMRRYFRAEVEGLDNVPATGAALLVGNHNGGLVSVDSFLAVGAIHDRHGVDRAVFGLAHDFLFHDPILRRQATRLGLLRAGRTGAHHALARGHLVLVYPGSDLDAFRPFTDRNRVVLGGRKGFVQVALREQVPIIPVVSAGSHEQFIVLTRGDRLARLFRLHRWARTDVCPIVFSIPWGISLGFVPYIPLPTQITVAFGAPIAWPELGPEAADDPAIVTRCYERVEDEMQATLDRISAGRRFLIGRPHAHSSRAP